MRFGFYLPNSGPTARPEPLQTIARKGDELVSTVWSPATIFLSPGK